MHAILTAFDQSASVCSQTDPRTYYGCLPHRQATGITRYLRIHSRMRGAVVARVIPVPFEISHLEVLRDIHKVIRSNRVAFISLTTHGSLFFCFLSSSEEVDYLFSTSQQAASFFGFARTIPEVKRQERSPLFSDRLSKNICHIG